MQHRAVLATHIKDAVERALLMFERSHVWQCSRRLKPSTPRKVQGLELFLQAATTASFAVQQEARNLSLHIFVQNLDILVGSS